MNETQRGGRRGEGGWESGTDRGGQAGEEPPDTAGPELVARGVAHRAEDAGLALRRNGGGSQERGPRVSPGAAAAPVGGWQGCGGAPARP